MALILVAIDPGTDGDHCPAAFIDEETGDLLFQGRSPTWRRWRMLNGTALPRITNPW